jgi:hypothetical protein
MTVSLSTQAPSEPALSASLVVLSAAHFPDSGACAPPPRVPGFIASEFAPLAADVAERCLRAHFGAPEHVGERGARTAIVLASPSGDHATAAAVASAVDARRRVSGLLFFQSVPNSIAGWIAARWRLCGPVVCTSPAGDPLADAALTAEILIEDGDADGALVVVVELADGNDDSPIGRASAHLVCAGT